MKQIAVIGSLNVDLVVESKRIPKLGETILGEKFSTFPGGKGANQAVAAARLGAQTTIFGTVGADGNGNYIRAIMENESVNTNYIQIDSEKESGVALIQLAQSDNCIIVVPGANQLTSMDYLKNNQEALLQYDVYLLQLEIPMETVEWAIDLLHQHRKTIILNPAPAVKLSQSIIDKVTYLTPNEHECAIILDSDEDLEVLIRRYPNKLIVTEGEKGVRFFDGNSIVHSPSIQVEVVDTTGAGDTFNGALAVALAEQKSLKEAVQFATIAAGISVTKAGAQGGMPTREQLENYLKE